MLRLAFPYSPFYSWRSRRLGGLVRFCSLTLRAFLLIDCASYGAGLCSQPTLRIDFQKTELQCPVKQAGGKYASPPAA
jgi:hypothetical protein